MISVRQYLFSVGNSCGLTRTLGELDVCRDASGQLCYTAGNSAVVFKIRHRGRLCALRCYTRPARNLEAIYGGALLREELFVFRDAVHGQWTDVVVSEWVEGETLHERIQNAGQEEFAQLAGAFDRLAAAMVADDRAHGDLKPENLIVLPDGSMQPIDLDAQFLPAFSGRESPELGTAAFQHPARTAADFDSRLDDFPAALISTALHALALDVSLRDRYDTLDTLLIDPRRLPHDPALTEILALFERHGRAAVYRIAKLLLSPTLRLHGLEALLHHTTLAAQVPAQELCELYAEGGRWGYRNPETGLTIIPPLYDNGFDFTEGLAAVQLGHTWHFIDSRGCTALSCPGYSAVKPFRNGRARVLGVEGWSEIDHWGSINVLEY